MKRLSLVAAWLLVGLTETFAGSDPEEPFREVDQALLQAVLDKDMPAFREALDSGADPNAILGEYDSEWPMCAAVRTGRTAFLVELLAHGGNPNLSNPGDLLASYPVTCSMLHSNSEAFDILLAAGADVNLKACPTCEYNADDSMYFNAVTTGNFDIALRIISITTISRTDLLETKNIVESEGTLQSARTRALAAHVEARGIPVQLPVKD